MITRQDWGPALPEYPSGPGRWGDCAGGHQGCGSCQLPAASLRAHSPRPAYARQLHPSPWEPRLHVAFFGSRRPALRLSDTGQRHQAAVDASSHPLHRARGSWRHWLCAGQRANTCSTASHCRQATHTLSLQKLYMHMRVHTHTVSQACTHKHAHTHIVGLCVCRLQASAES